MNTIDRIMNICDHFLPREKKFQTLIEELAIKANEAAILLTQFGIDNPEVIAENIKTVENEADLIVHKISEGLLYDHTRVTEEKGDIRYFIHNLDNIIDNIDAAAFRISISNNSVIVQNLLKSFTPLIKKCTEEILLAIKCLPELKENDNKIREAIKNINTYENEGDKEYKKWIQILVEKEFRFEGERMLLHETLKRLERVLDDAEDVSHTLDTCIIKGGI